MIRNRLKEIRMKEYMMTQTEFAEYLGIHRNALSKYESGIRIPDTATLYKICKKLNKNIFDIIDEECEETNRK